jgi:hypothetical protein
MCALTSIKKRIKKINSSDHQYEADVVVAVVEQLTRMLMLFVLHQCYLPCMQHLALACDICCKLKILALIIV